MRRIQIIQRRYIISITVVLFYHTIYQQYTSSVCDRINTHYSTANKIDQAHTFNTTAPMANMQDVMVSALNTAMALNWA